MQKASSDILETFLLFQDPWNMHLDPGGISST